MKPTSRKMYRTSSRLWAARSPVMLLLLLTSLATFSAVAHPGHSLGDHGVGHVLASPYHLLILGGVGVALWLGAWFVQRRLPRRLLQAGGLAALGTAMLLAFGM